MAEVVETIIGAPLGNVFIIAGMIFLLIAVVGWCASRGIPKGDVRLIEQVWAFATEWYARHADADWNKWSVQEAAEIFMRSLKVTA